MGHLSTAVNYTGTWKFSVRITLVICYFLLRKAMLIVPWIKYTNQRLASVTIAVNPAVSYKIGHGILSF